MASSSLGRRSSSVASITSNAADSGPAARERIKRRRKQRREDAAELPDDGFQWHMYGEKPLVNSSFVRTYYRCNQRDRGCPAKKTVDRHQQCSATVRVAYEGKHTHQPPSRAVREVIIFRSPSTTSTSTSGAGNGGGAGGSAARPDQLQCLRVPDTSCTRLGGAQPQAALHGLPLEQPAASREAGKCLSGLQAPPQQQQALGLEGAARAAEKGRSAAASAQGLKSVARMQSQPLPPGGQVGPPYLAAPQCSLQPPPASYSSGLQTLSAPLQSLPYAAAAEQAGYGGCRERRWVPEGPLSSPSSPLEDIKPPFNGALASSSLNTRRPLPRAFPCLQGMLDGSFASSVAALMGGRCCVQHGSRHVAPSQSLLSGPAQGRQATSSGDVSGSTSMGSTFSAPAQSVPEQQLPLRVLPACSFGPAGGMHGMSMLPPLGGAAFERRAPLLAASPRPYTCTIQNGKNLPLAAGDMAACGDATCANGACCTRSAAPAPGSGGWSGLWQPGTQAEPAADEAFRPYQRGHEAGATSLVAGHLSRLSPDSTCMDALAPLVRGCEGKQPLGEEEASAAHLEETAAADSAASTSPTFPTWLSEAGGPYGAAAAGASFCSLDLFESGRDLADLYPELGGLELGGDFAAASLGGGSDLTSLDCLVDVDLFDPYLGTSVPSLMASSTTSNSSCTSLPSLVSPSLSSPCSSIPDF